MSKKNSLLKKSPYNVLIPAGLFIGIGVGLLVNQVAAGTLIGLGLGFGASYFVASKK